MFSSLSRTLSHVFPFSIRSMLPGTVHLHFVQDTPSQSEQGRCSGDEALPSLRQALRPPRGAKQCAVRCAKLFDSQFLYVSLLFCTRWLGDFWKFWNSWASWVFQLEQLDQRCALRLWARFRRCWSLRSRKRWKTMQFQLELAPAGTGWRQLMLCNNSVSPGLQTRDWHSLKSMGRSKSFFFVFHLCKSCKSPTERRWKGSVCSNWHANSSNLW